MKTLTTYLSEMCNAFEELDGCHEGISHCPNFITHTICSCCYSCLLQGTCNNQALLKTNY